jgi:hypothetical protein
MLHPFWKVTARIGDLEKAARIEGHQWEERVELRIETLDASCGNADRPENHYTPQYIRPHHTKEVIFEWVFEDWTHSESVSWFWVLGAYSKRPQSSS